MSETCVCAVTGASGYVGSILAAGLRQHFPVVAMVRHAKLNSDLQWSLQSRVDLAPVLRELGVKVLVHAAWDMRASARLEVEETCVKGSLRLFEMAARAGVERIVFISTISAFEGCRSVYGQTKLAVERGLSAHSVPYVILRPGLVFGPDPGGVLGGIRHQVQRSRLLPIIGRGRTPQYLLDQETLASTVCRAAHGEFDHLQATPITLAHPKPWPFRELVKSIAVEERRKVTLVPLPPPILYMAIRTAESLGLQLPFRSDSIVSFVHYDRKPDFRILDTAGISPLPYQIEHSTTS
jgi:nucleoside-diphosphate-sugar epimerase